MKSDDLIDSAQRSGLVGLFKSIKRALKVRRDLPEGLEKEFEEFKDIQSIDRIHVAAWIGVVMSIGLFGLDYHRVQTGKFYENIIYQYLFYLHILGLMYFIPAWSILRNKKWIIASKLRRGLHIWGMVFLVFLVLFNMSILVFLERDGLVMFVAFLFISGWMFSMSHKERLVFNCVTLITILYVIYSKETTSYSKFSMYFEILFLSIVAFFFDAFDYNLKVTNFLNRKSIEKDQKKIRELEEFKSRFFTNLTHELRTPLTIISGMAGEITENPKRWAVEGAQIIERNSTNLLNLVNQILDLSKIESGTLQLQMIKGDIIPYVGYLVDSFKGHAQTNHIQLHFNPEENEIIMDYEPDFYITILSNLISNAIKFTPVDGNIYVDLSLRNSESDSFLEISVRDTGVGISQEALPHIFERFYQAENNLQTNGVGSGIGLSVVKELVQLLNGDISVKSVLGRGTQFNLSLPISTAASPESEVFAKKRIPQNLGDTFPSTFEIQDDINNSLDEKPEVLIIEDNNDVITFLQICLDDLFRLTIARDGQQGITSAIETIPDIILSDVMMPVKDGLTVCRKLKQDLSTSHIPIVLLSAKTDVDSRIAGLESGADVYMVKPFDKRELRAQLQTLLDQRKEYQERYSNPDQPAGAKVTPAKAKEDEFVIKVRNIVTEHLDDHNFGVMHLCRAVFLSRTQLHKKLKALTGLSASLFIRNIRLRAGRELLRTTDLNVAEIAYQVGFDDPNYFSRCFAQEFGTPPSETRK